jgi:hypothetical protein
MPAKKLSNNLESFLRHIEAIKDTLPMTLLLIEPHAKKTVEDFMNFMDTKGETATNSKGEQVIQVRLNDSKYFELLERNASISTLATKIIHQSLFVSLISQFDAFINKLLRAIYDIKPETLISSDKSITFSQFFELNSMESAKEFLIEKEIESVLRKSIQHNLNI